MQVKVNPEAEQVLQLVTPPVYVPSPKCNPPVEQLTQIPLWAENPSLQVTAEIPLTNEVTVATFNHLTEESIYVVDISKQYFYPYNKAWPDLQVAHKSEEVQVAQFVLHAVIAVTIAFVMTLWYPVSSVVQSATTNAYPSTAA